MWPGASGRTRTGLLPPSSRLTRRWPAWAAMSAPHGRAAGEGDQVDLGGDQQPAALAVTGQGAQHVLAERLGGVGGEQRRRVGGGLGGLEHHGVPGGERRGAAPGGHQQRVVPRDDGRDHADRLPAHPALVPRQVAAAWRARCRYGRPRRRSGTGRRPRGPHAAASASGFPVAGLLQHRVLGEVPLDQVGQRVEAALALARGERAPVRPGGPGPGHGRGDLLGARRDEGAPGVAGARVGQVEFGGGGNGGRCHGGASGPGQRGRWTARGTRTARDEGSAGVTGRRRAARVRG